MKTQIERLILHFSWIFYSLFPPKNKYSWVVGVDEIASVLRNISLAVPNSCSVCLSRHAFYSNEYNYYLNTTSKLMWLARHFMGPFLLGKLMHQADGFIYIWDTGFLSSRFDAREYEFSFLKKHGKRIVCYFVGNDIRSPAKLLDFAKDNNIEVPANYYYINAPSRLTYSYELKKKRNAHVTDTYADIVFNAIQDQMGYLEKPAIPFIYLYDSEKFVRNDEKYSNMAIIRIVHAPSSPVVKGTQLVRAAIARLRKEGEKIKYIEIYNKTNTEVLKEVRNAHIVLNEFFSLVPGMFGVEAMASHCALLTSADEKYESSLPKGSNSAWFVTRGYEIYDHLKLLLHNHALVKAYADKGYEWAWENASISIAGKKFLKIIQGK